MDSLVLVFNCGSSSIKSAVLQPSSGEVYISYLVENVNLPKTQLIIKTADNRQTIDLKDNTDHTEAIRVLVQDIEKRGLQQSIHAVGHRVVQGGELFQQSVVINEEVIDNIKRCCNLAPLHNPSQLIGIAAAQEVLSLVAHVAVFDTSFHQTIPKEAYLYAIPYEYYEQYHIRRYGMHGISYRYVSQEAKRLLDARNHPADRLVIAHLGNGASLCAVKKGKSVHTTMGLTPLEGLIMGTRSGNIDPSIFPFLKDNAQMDIAQTNDLLNKQSGMLGISGISSDLREIEAEAQQGNKRAQLALDMFIYRAAELISAMVCATGGLDALVFTGGIGENSSLIRAGIIKRLQFLDLILDQEANENISQSKQGAITSSQEPIALVVPTNEELMIARDVQHLTGMDLHSLTQNIE